MIRFAVALGLVGTGALVSNGLVTSWTSSAAQRLSTLEGDEPEESAVAVALAAAVSLGLLLGLLFGGGTGTRAGGAAAAPDDSKTVIAPEEQLGLVQDVFHELGWKSTEFDVTYLMQCGRCAETKSLLVWDETSLPAGLTDR